MNLSNRLEKLKTNKIFGRFYGIIVLILLAAVFWAIFMILTPNNFGSPEKLYYYLQSSIIYSVGACGFYFIVVMGLFDFSIGANVVLSSIVGVVLSKEYGYAGLLVGCILCGTIIGFINGFIYIKLKIPSMIVTVGLMLIYESLAYFVAQAQSNPSAPRCRPSDMRRQYHISAGSLSAEQPDHQVIQRSEHTATRSEATSTWQEHGYQR